MKETFLNKDRLSIYENAGVKRYFCSLKPSGLEMLTVVSASDVGDRSLFLQKNFRPWRQRLFHQVHPT
jgi:hypothetical protein